MNNSTTDRKVLSLLGLAMKAGKVVSGEFQTESCVKEGTACLVIVAEDASDNTKKLFRDKTGFRSIPFKLYGTKATLGRALGKEYRASLAVTEQGFADAICKKIEENGNQA